MGEARGRWGWTLFGLIWGLALFGVIMKSLLGLRHPILSMVLYLGRSWLAVTAIRPLWDNIPMAGLLLIAAGGVAFYAAEGRRYSHLVRHLFVLVGTCCHFFAVL